MYIKAKVEKLEISVQEILIIQGMQHPKNLYICNFVEIHIFYGNIDKLQSVFFHE